MATAPKASREKVSDKFAFAKQADGTLKDQTDYTEARIARYQSVVEATGKPAIEMDFTPQYDAMVSGGIEAGLAAVTVAFAIEGFLTKAGHASNKARNGDNADGNEKGALEDFLANALEGGWTNRQGGNEVGVQKVWEAYAELRNVPVERVQQVWNGYTDENGNVVAGYSDADKKAVRSNTEVRAIIKKKEWEKAEALRQAAKTAAGDAPAAALPGV